MTNSAEYKVSFYKKGEEKDEYLGQIIVDDVGTSNNFTLIAKAFRLANPSCLLGDRVIVERV